MVSSYTLLPETHQMLHKTIKDFANDVLKTKAADVDKNKTYPKEQVMLCF